MKRISGAEAEAGFEATKTKYPHLLLADIEQFANEISQKEQSDDFSFDGYVCESLPMDRFLMVELENGEIVNVVVDISTSEVIWKDASLTKGREYSGRLGDMRLNGDLVYSVDKDGHYVINGFRDALSELEITRPEEVRDLCFEIRPDAIVAAEDYSKEFRSGLIF